MLKATRAKSALAALVLATCGCGGAAEDAGAVDAVTSCNFGIAAAERAARLAWLSDGVAAAVRAFEAQYAPAGAFVCPAPGATTGAVVHSFGDYALAKRALSTAAGAKEPLADAAVRCLFTFEQAGVFPFHLGDAPRIADNSNEFALLPLATLLARYPADAALAADVAPRIMAALDQIEGHAVCPAYTNICLMQASEVLALGQWLAVRPDAGQRAYGRARIASAQARLDGWLSFTRGAGLTEFGSPTYNEVDLEVLLAARLAAPDAATRAKISAALDFVWANLASSYFAGRGSLAGSLSRTYDFLTGMGGLTLSTYLEGLRKDLPSQSPDLAKAILLVSANAGGYRPPAKSLCLAAPPTREVLATFGPAGAAGRERSLFVTPDFALGAASADYGSSLSSAQDEMIRAELASSPRTPVFAVIPDYLDSPGAAVQAGDFQKITHLLLSPAAVQKQGALLALLEVPARDPGYSDAQGRRLPLVNLASNVTLPAQADEILLDGAPADASRDTRASAQPTLVVRIGSGAITVGVLAASGLECARPDGSISGSGAPEVHLKPLSAASAAREASARLAVYHAKSLPADTSQLANCFARLAVLLAGAHCDPANAACARDLHAKMAGAIRAASQKWDASTGDWNVHASFGGHDLHVHRKVGVAPQILAREVDGAPVQFAPLRVNGADVPLGP